MEFLTIDFLTSLLLIVGIDLVLAGDNAIVIALAASKLEEKQRKTAIIIGTIGAIGIRAIATLVVVWLLQVPGLHLIGGLLLVWIAYSLLLNPKEEKGIEAKSGLGAAIGTIVMADALMGLDNVLAIGGAASGHYLLVIIGLLISIPLVMGGSVLFLKLVARYPWITFAGSGVLAFTAGKMIFTEPFIRTTLDEIIWLKWPAILLIVGSVVFAGWKKQRKSAKTVLKTESV